MEQPKTLAELSEQIFRVLCWYPFMFGAGILITGGIFRSDVLMMFVMATWVVFIFIGFLSWLILLFYLPIKKKMSIKKILLHVLIFMVGSYFAFYIYEYDILSTGAKYID